MMRALTLAELAGPLQACLVGGDGTVRGVTIDSRKVAVGDLFVAFKGERVDGHRYLEQAAAAGAVAALVSEQQDLPLPQLVVADTQQALGRLGAYNRSLYRGPLVAITGSSGKTTVKNMVHAVLSQCGVTLATEGNYNNEIGVPLTLLRLSPEHHFAVVEMGAAGAGHIRWLCELGRPTVSMLLNAMAAHLDGFGSVEGVAAAKGEIFDGLGAGDTAIINADQPWAAQWRARAGDARILDFSREGDAAVTARDIRQKGVAGTHFTLETPHGEVPVTLQLPGDHNVTNALAAACAGLACGLAPAEIAAGLAAVSAVPGRLAQCRTAAGATLIDDCYNANPGSMRAALELLAACEGRRIAALGAMKELGADSASLHRELGGFARQIGIDELLGVGEELVDTVAGFGDGARHFDSMEALLAWLQRDLGEGDTLLVKGSRSAGMERVVEALSAAGEEGGTCS